MKFVLCLIALLALASCGEEIDGWDRLSEAEREALRQRYAARCESESEKMITNFKTNSDKVFTTHGDWARGKGFEHEYKQGDTVRRKLELRVWKRSEEASERVIYFLVTQEEPELRRYFLRVKASDNVAVIDQLHKDHCNTTLKNFSFSVREAGPIGQTYEYVVPMSDNKKDEVTDAYTYHFSRPSLFASYALSRKIVRKNSKDEQEGQTINRTSTFKVKTYEHPFPSTDPAYYDPQEYCEFFLSGNRVQPSEYGFRLECSSGPGDFILEL